jgi:hypothetical protein
MLLAAVISPIGMLPAQAKPDSVKPARVWIRIPIADGGLDSGIAGTLQRTSGDTAFIGTDSDKIIPVPLRNEQRYFVSKGRHSRASTGGLVGLGVGVFGGIVACEAIAGESEADPFCTSEEGALIGGAGGVAIGLLIGSMIHHESWEEVPVERLRIAVGPNRGGKLQIRLSHSFRGRLP